MESPQIPSWNIGKRYGQDSISGHGSCQMMKYMSYVKYIAKNAKLHCHSVYIRDIKEMYRLSLARSLQAEVIAASRCHRVYFVLQTLNYTEGFKVMTMKAGNFFALFDNWILTLINGPFLTTSLSIFRHSCVTKDVSERAECWFNALLSSLVSFPALVLYVGFSNFSSCLTITMYCVPHDRSHISDRKIITNRGWRTSTEEHTVFVSMTIIKLSPSLIKTNCRQTET